MLLCFYVLLRQLLDVMLDSSCPAGGHDLGRPPHAANVTEDNLLRATVCVDGEQDTVKVSASI